MNKRKLHTRFVAAGLVILLLLAIAYFHENPPFFYYTQTFSPHELPTQFIRRAFRYVSKKELPNKADDLRAIFAGGRDPSMLVKFHTDSEGVAYLLDTFDGVNVESKTVEKDLLRSDVKIFSIPSLWQEKIGVTLFDQKSIESGRELEFNPGPGDGKAPGYQIFIDNQRSTVYIYSWLH